MTHEPLSRSGGVHWHAVVDAASCAMSVDTPPERPTHLANNHAWHSQNIIGEHLLAAARGGGAAGTTDRRGAGEARRRAFRSSPHDGWPTAPCAPATIRARMPERVCKPLRPAPCLHWTDSALCCRHNDSGDRWQLTRRRP
jgi:hypothetical protein